MLKATKIDATQGPILKLIILYTIPLILSTLVQSLFNAVDIVVLGNMADSAAVASVGATTAIVHLIVNTFVGLSNGTKIILTRQIGARDREGVQKTVDTSLISACVGGFLIMIVGMILSAPILNWTNCPSDCFDGALVYLRLYMLAAPAVLVYNYGSAILRASGDTQRPLYYILACGLLNVILNIVLCLILPQKVAAVAIATAASQYLGAVLVVRRLCRSNDICRTVLSRLRWCTSTFLHIMRYGLPVAFTQALYPLSNLQIQTAVNSFEVAGIAGSSAATTVDTLSSSCISALGTTTMAFIGQNLGAENHDRVKKSFKTCLLLNFCIGLTTGLFFYCTGRFWLRMILGNDLAAIEYAMIKMGFVTRFGAISALNAILSNAIQAFGYPSLTTVSSVACVFGVRTFWMQFIYPHFQTFEWLMACFTTTWILLLIVHLLFFGVIYARYKKGVYRRI